MHENEVILCTLVRRYYTKIKTAAVTGCRNVKYESGDTEMENYEK